MTFRGFLGFIGRSRDLRELDAAFRVSDLHPQLVPEAIKLAMLRLLATAAREEADGMEAGMQGADRALRRRERAAALVAYCMLGPEAFATANGEVAAQDIERRIEAALGAEGSLDARLILLTLYAGVIQPSIVAAFRLEAETH